MKSLLGVLGAMTAALTLVAGVVFGLDDDSVMIPPPESICEGFVRALAGTRYERALPYLGDDLRDQVRDEGIRSYMRRLLKRNPDISNVEGKPGWIRGDSAEARVTITSNVGERSLRFPLNRSEGGWSIAELDTMSDAIR